MQRGFNIDWKRQNKIVLRNFSESQDHHDMVKTILVRMLRRRYPDSHKIPIYTELDNGDGIGDVWIRIKSDIYIFEIQKTITNPWLEEMGRRYSEVNLIVIPLKGMPTELEALKLKLKEYLI